MNVALSMPMRLLQALYIASAAAFTDACTNALNSTTSLRSLAKIITSRAQLLDQVLAIQLQGRLLQQTNLLDLAARIPHRSWAHYVQAPPRRVINEVLKLPSTCIMRSLVLTVALVANERANSLDNPRRSFVWKVVGAHKHYVRLPCATCMTPYAASDLIERSAFAKTDLWSMGTYGANKRTRQF